MEENKSERRRKGQGSIMLKPNGTYRGRITVSGYDTYSCTGKTKKEVEKKLETFRISTLKGEAVPKKIFVNSYIESWLQEVKKPSLKPASYDRLERTYQGQIRDSPVGRCQLGNIRTIDIQRLINEKSRTLSYSSLKKVYELLNACFSHAVAIREMSFNPVTAVKMPKKENLAKQTKTIEIFSAEELAKIEQVAKITYSTGRVKYKHIYLFILLANTGMRAGEALAITWKDVDLEKHLIHIKKNASMVIDREGETGKKYKTIITTVKSKSGNRVIPCNEKAMEALNYLKEYQETQNIYSDFVICNDHGGILNQKTLPHILEKILKAADVRYRNVHSFRHTFATNLIQAGVDVKVVSQLLGHHSVKITYDTYVHTKLDSAIEAVNLLNTNIEENE